MLTHELGSLTDLCPHAGHATIGTHGKMPIKALGDLVVAAPPVTSFRQVKGKKRLVCSDSDPQHHVTERSGRD